MFDGEWRSKITIEKVVIWLALLAIMGIVALPNFGSGQNSGQQNIRAEGNKMSDLWAPSSFGKKVDPLSGEYSASCKHPGSREEAELCLQWRAADSAEKSTKIAQDQTKWNWVQFVGMLATVAAAWAAAVAARAAQQSIAVAEGTAERQLRAYIFLDEAKLENFADRDKAFAKLMIKNSGQTTAYEVRTKVGRVIRFRDDSSDFPVTPPANSGSETIINPEGIFKTGILLNFTADELAFILQGQGILFIFGHISYKDAFKKSHVACFRMLYDARNSYDNDGIAFCSEGNEAT